MLHFVNLLYDPCIWHYPHNNSIIKEAWRLNKNFFPPLGHLDIILHAQNRKLIFCMQNGS